MNPPSDLAVPVQAPAGPWFRRLHWQILLAMLFALVLGFGLRSAGWHESPWIEGPARALGEIFLRLLKMVIVPLVFATVASGIASIDPTRVGRIGARTLVYYLVTSGLAVVTGLVLVVALRPGDGFSPIRCSADDDCSAGYSCTDGGCSPQLDPAPLSQVLLEIIPVNPFASLATTYDLPGTILFAILLGLAIARLGDRARALREGLEGLGDAMSWITDRIMRVAPLGVFALVLQVILSTGLEVIGGLAKYVVTVTLGLAVHGVLTIPALYLLVTRRSPVAFARSMSPALMMAFSTASSSATLPVTYDCVDRAGVDRRVSSFVLPLGATVNMDGTALYQAVAALFIAQAWGIELTLGQQFVVFLTATLASIGAAGVPSAGLVTMIIVLQAVGLPLEGIGMVVAVDRLLDMMRTAVNVWGDGAGTAVVAALESRDAPPEPDDAPDVPASA